MGKYNFLVEGVSATGKTTVCHELRRRGIRALNGDTDLAYVGDPETGEPLEGAGSHEHHIWPVAQVRALAADTDDRFTFFCGGSRNVHHFLDVFDRVFVLTVDTETLRRRLDERPADEFGSKPEERELILRLHATGEDVPDGITIDATAPVPAVVDEVLRQAQLTAAESSR